MNLKTLALAAAFAIAAGAANATPSHGSCYISAGGNVMLDGPCGYSFIDYGKGSMTITAVDGKVVAHLYVDGVDHDSAHVMDGGENGHAVLIGGMYLTREGGCWVDDSTKRRFPATGRRPQRVKRPTVDPHC
jgi:hypothetical protein